MIFTTLEYELSYITYEENAGITTKVDMKSIGWYEY